ncbi:MAG TPA: hypothetical protein PK082_02340, partial [Phycisphaerae bacterium]|nr:hypothetical protein [Phycisphaerae bacterium]
MIWQYAGVAGVDPGPRTLRELVWMAEARDKADWSRTARLLALLANCHRDPKKTRPFQAADFDPYAGRKRPDDAIEVRNLGLLKEAFEKNRPKAEGRRPKQQQG